MFILAQVVIVIMSGMNNLKTGVWLWTIEGTCTTEDGQEQTDIELNGKRFFVDPIMIID